MNASDTTHASRTEDERKIIYVCSDAVGETAEAVARATIRQFRDEEMRIRRYGQLRREEEIVAIVREAQSTGGFIAFTLVQPELREMMKEEAQRRGVRIVDVMGPMMQAYIDTMGGLPSRKPGLMHAMDEAYYRRIEAIEFAVQFDDGKDARGLAAAEVVLLGVSRTSKTPLSIFLAHKGIKVANFPLVPEVHAPQELAAPVPGRLLVGLTIQPEHLVKIREERLRAMGLPPLSRYAAMGRIREELDDAAGVMDRLGCRMIDVTDRAIEESASIIAAWLNEKNPQGLHR
ncbi:kinase/pyrophosphorylase [Paenibacillus sp. IB182496]|uniref:Putative pyruvate, phosphate dikinase regulatory protein n=1 Tax=Paenibacillus sabuli TaxID=2772509 RepID=A0A927BPG8_9BACL|nr:pyruvate, water dikinase regulatory protein [Paenibacillus sabuli]MBD2844332.1 kinase/pyrophosphorylase [Paenibacillus sabuli]